jgi:hypothetical protein
MTYCSSTAPCRRYLDTCKLVDFEYFPVKEPSFVEQTRKKTPRLLGIGERTIVLLHEKTKAVMFQVRCTYSVVLLVRL